MTALVEPVTAVGRSAIADAATRSGAEMLEALGVGADGGLASADVSERQVRSGPNSVAAHRARLLMALLHQLASPLLGRSSPASSSAIWP